MSLKNIGKNKVYQLFLIVLILGLSAQVTAETLIADNHYASTEIRDIIESLLERSVDSGLVIKSDGI